MGITGTKFTHEHVAEALEGIARDLEEFGHYPHAKGQLWRFDPDAYDQKAGTVVPGPCCLVVNPTLDSRCGIMHRLHPDEKVTDLIDLAMDFRRAVELTIEMRIKELLGEEQYKGIGMIAWSNVTPTAQVVAHLRAWAQLEREQG